MLSLIVLVLYGIAIRAPFAYDDRIHILENPVVRAFHSVSDVDAIQEAFTGPSTSSVCISLCKRHLSLFRATSVR